MGFTIYRVEADYVRPRADIAGPGWVCQTRELAEGLMQTLQDRQDLKNLRIREHRYGY